MAKKECQECQATLKFRFAPSDYICPNCNKSYSKHEIDLFYGEV